MEFSGAEVSCVTVVFNPGICIKSILVFLTYEGQAMTVYN